MRKSLTLAPLLLALAACGGGDGGGDRLSKEAWVTRADAICARVNDRLEQTEQPETMTELVKVLDQGLEDVNTAVADLRALEPPEDDEAKVDAWLANVERASVELKKARDAAQDEDQAALAAALESGTKVNDEGNAQARELGLTECAEE